MPAPVPEGPRRLHSAARDHSDKNRPKPFQPKANCLMCDVDALLVKQLLTIAQRQWISDIHHYRQADDLGRGLQVWENAGVVHGVE